MAISGNSKLFFCMVIVMTFGAQPSKGCKKKMFFQEQRFIQQQL